MKKGFTMIELIFVIVILGILAAVAIPKLAATRNDAKIAAEMTNIAQIITNLGAEYTSQGAFVNIEPATESVSLKCFTMVSDAGDLVEGNFTVGMIVSDTDPSCPLPVKTGVQAKALANGIINTAAIGNAAEFEKEYSFGSIGIVE